MGGGARDGAGNPVGLCAAGANVSGLFAAWLEPEGRPATRCPGRCTATRPSGCGCGSAAGALAGAYRALTRYVPTGPSCPAPSRAPPGSQRQHEHQCPLGGGGGCPVEPGQRGGAVARGGRGRAAGPAGLAVTLRPVGRPATVAVTGQGACALEAAWLGEVLPAAQGLFLGCARRPAGDGGPLHPGRGHPPCGGGAVPLLAGSATTAGAAFRLAPTGPPRPTGPGLCGWRRPCWWRRLARTGALTRGPHRCPGGHPGGVGGGGGRREWGWGGPDGRPGGGVRSARTGNPMAGWRLAGPAGALQAALEGGFEVRFLPTAVATNSSEAEDDAETDGLPTAVEATLTVLTTTTAGSSSGTTTGALLEAVSPVRLCPRQQVLQAARLGPPCAR
ncbi:hypothetical protein PAPYR_7306 [Paratrimastix pyriformis]|uniref:Uncharacterized protein n=1 Tax=Paratrimastix pyriformis TaxID=342808 RepID=A0ABQ8UJ34_9EUKA|nr:hypothetical protein PAPYR_7306 [Paratrimastix pyriformis]